MDYNGVLKKIQVKTTEKLKNNECMIFEICRTNGFKCVNKPYTPEEIDYYFLYCIENGWCGLLSIQESGSLRTVKMHFEFPKNNRFDGFKMQEDYAFDYKVNEIITGEIIKPTDNIIKLRCNNLKEEVNKNYINSINLKTTRETLKEQIRLLPFTQIAVLYGVSTTTIRKWCKVMNLPYRVSDIKDYSDEEWERI